MARYRVGLETRERIVAATRDLVARMGIDDVTLKAITDEAGVGAGSFYNLFASKEAVIFEVIREAIAAVDPDPQGTGTDGLDDLVAAFVAFIVDDAPVARIYLQLAVGRGLVDPVIAERVLRAHERRLERFADAYRREYPHVKAVEARRWAESLLAGLTGLGLNALLDADFDLTDHAELLLDQLRGSSVVDAGPHEGAERDASILADTTPATRRPSST